MQERLATLHVITAMWKTRIYVPFLYDVLDLCAPHENIMVATHESDMDDMRCSARRTDLERRGSS